MRRVNISEAQQRLPELIIAAAAGEDVVIFRDDGVAVRLVSMETRPLPRFGSAEGMFTMRDDFDAPLDDFAAYER